MRVRIFLSFLSPRAPCHLFNLPTRNIESRFSYVYLESLIIMVQGESVRETALGLLIHLLDIKLQGQFLREQASIISDTTGSFSFFVYFIF